MPYVEIAAFLQDKSSFPGAFIKGSKIFNAASHHGQGWQKM
jgi:hypothetical protein